jgi:hypothetical protein
MNLDELVPSQSKYLAKEDAGTAGINLTIKEFKRETVGRGKDADECAVIHFEEDVKPMVLNKTNKNRIKHYLGVTTSEEAVGKVINAYNDPDVEYGGEIIGGLRLRGEQGKANDPAKAASDDFDDDIPF